MTVQTAYKTWHFLPFSSLNDMNHIQLDKTPHGSQLQTDLKGSSVATRRVTGMLVTSSKVNKHKITPPDDIATSGPLQPPKKFSPPSLWKVKAGKVLTKKKGRLQKPKEKSPKNWWRGWLFLDVLHSCCFGIGLKNAGLDRSENYSIVLMVLQEMLSHLRKLQKLSWKGVYMIAIR